MKPILLSLLTVTAILGAATIASRVWPTPNLAQSAVVSHDSHRHLLASPRAADIPKGSPIVPASESAPSTALATAERIQVLRRQSAHARAAEFIRPDRREGTLAVVRAVDAVLEADADLHETAERTYGFPLPPSWNLCVMADNLGVFSTHVKFISEDVRGDRAAVTLQEGDNIPLVHARFDRAGESWLYVPEIVPPGTVPQLNRLAHVVRDVTDSVRQGAPIESLADAFTFRILPQVARVVEQSDSAALAAGRDPD